MDKFNTRWGKFRPLMLFSNIGLILSFLLLFSTHYFSGVLQVVVFLVALVFHKIVYSVQQTVTKAAQPALTNDPSQRPLFSIYDTVFSSIGVFAMGQVVVSNFLAPRHGGEFNQAFFAEFLLGIMIISAVLTTLAIIGISRKDRTEYFGLGEGTVETKSLKDYWSVIKGNTPLISLALCGGLMKFIAQLLSDQAFLVILFGIVLGNYGLSGQLSLWQIVPNLLIVIFFTRLATRKDLKTSYTVSIIIAMLSTLTMLVVLWTSEDTTQIFANGGFMAILFGAAFIAMKVTSSYPTSIVLTMSADISDFETSRSGRFVSGLIGTVFSLTDSIASSLAPIFIGFVVAGIGYKDAYPDASEPLTSNISNGILILLGIPLVLYFLVFVLIRKYPLNREAMEKVQVTIAEKKREDLYQ